MGVLFGTLPISGAASENVVDVTKTESVSVLKDTFVKQGDGGHGGDPILYAKQPFNKGGSTNRLTYLAFPIAELPAKPDKVSLRVYITQSGTNATYADTELQLHASENLEWSETETVWNNKPAIEPDMLAAFKPGNIHEDNPNSAPVWADLDVTDYITAAKAAGKEAVTFVIATNDSGSATTGISSKENDDGNAAKLTYTYTEHAYHWPESPTVKAERTEVGASLEWPEPVRESGGTDRVYYEIYQDGEKIAVTQELQYMVPYLSPNQKYSYSVSARNEDATKSTELLSLGVLEKELGTAKTASVVVDKDTYVRWGNVENGTGKTELISKFPYGTTSSTARTTFLGFDDIGAIPSNASQVLLKVYAVRTVTNKNVNPSNTNIVIHSSDNTDWNETTVLTGKMTDQVNAPEIAARTVPVINHDDAGNYDTEAKAQWIDFDVTEYITQQRAAGKNKATLVITSNNGSGDGSVHFVIDALEKAGGNPAKLEYTYQSYAWTGNGEAGFGQRGMDSAELFWPEAVSKEENAEPAVYDVYRDGNKVLDGVTGESCTVSGLEQGKSYHFAVKARNSSGTEHSVPLDLGVLNFVESFYTQSEEKSYIGEGQKENWQISGIENEVINQNFTFEADIMLNSGNTSGPQLRLCDSKGIKVLQLNFLADAMTAINEKNTLYGMEEQLPYDSGANGNEWSFIMLPGLKESAWKSVKIYFDFGTRQYDLYFNNVLVGEKIDFTNKDAGNLAGIEWEVPNGANCTIKNVGFYTGRHGMYYTPVRFTDESGQPLTTTAAGQTVKAVFSAVNADDTTANIELIIVQGYGEEGRAEEYQIKEISLPSDERIHTFEYPFTAKGNDNIRGFVWNSLENMHPWTPASVFLSDPPQKETAQLFMIGDSTMGPAYVNGETWPGWAAAFSGHLNERIAFMNYARSGTSSRTWWRSGRPMALGEKIQPGDYILFQLGHNDVIGKGSKKTSIEEYQAYLKSYAAFARSKGAHFVFITPPVQKADISKELAEGSLYANSAAMKAVAEETGLPVIDLNEKTWTEFQTMDANELYRDGTHFTEYGSELVAQYVTALLREKKLDIVRFL